jgi:hypothetical protein
MLNVRQPPPPCRAYILSQITVEIHNKRESEEYKVDERMCIGFLMTLANPNSSCYGPNNNDTKGGTWEVSILSLLQYR